MGHFVSIMNLIDKRCPLRYSYYYIRNSSEARVSRKKSLVLTDHELRLMEVLWNRGPSTVAEVVQSLASEVNLAYSTVLTTLRILEQKGYLSHQASGRAFIYRANVERDEAQREVVNNVVARFFGGSPRDLVLNLLESESVDDAELARLRELIDRKKGPA